MRFHPRKIISSLQFSCALLTVWYDWWIDFWCTLDPPFSLYNYANLFSYSVSKFWPNYSGIVLLVKGICSTEQTLRFLDQLGLKIRGEPGPPGTSPRSTTAIDRGVFAIAMIYHVGNYSAKNFRSDLTDLYGCLLPRKDVFTYNSLD